jgi:outer membrane protein TolC
LRERTERLFRAGEIDYAELALARRDEVQARIALLEARLAVSSAQIDMDAATGAITFPGQ